MSCRHLQSSGAAALVSRHVMAQATGLRIQLTTLSLQ